jgi:TldD protein
VVTRRRFVQTSALLAAASSIPSPLWGAVRGNRSAIADAVPPIQDPAIKALCDVSLDVARSAGASYADARIDHTYTYRFGSAPPEEEIMAFGVRVLVDGYWGFASSPVWSTEEAVRLARAAVRNARANNIAKQRITELAPLSGNGQKLTGHWTTPIVDDPFEMSPDEIRDFLLGIRMFMKRIPGVNPQGVSATFMKQEKAFASTEGHYVTQRLYQTSGAFPFTVEYKDRKVGTSLDTTTPAGAGFEHLRGQPLREQILQKVEEAKADLMLPFIPVDVGRYDAVLDANTVASLLSETIGAATELDRALGYEANATGTSYILEPVDMIGTFKVGNPAITVTANRTEPGGAATVRWDDEGVTPSEFTLIKEGVLADMQTDREGASVLRSVYDHQGKPTHSYGCAFAPDARLAPLVHCGNLQLQPGAGDETFESLIGQLSKGVAFKRGSADMDFQQTTGLISGQAYEIKNGKRTAILYGAGVNFRTPELWNSLMAIGGTSSRKRLGTIASKGQPRRNSTFSVTACPASFKELTVIDLLRKA